MAFLEDARDALDRFCPKLGEALAGVPFDELEGPNSPAIRLFREAQGPGLLVPQSFGGAGANALEASHVHRALGAIAPSLSIAATMHNFSVATFVEYNLYGDEGRELLQSVGRDRALVASGFAEGRTGASVLDSRMRAHPVEGGYRLEGSKKPCSLSRSMDVLTAGVAVVEPSGSTRRAIAMVPGTSPGISRRPFWTAPVLGGAESDEVILEDVFIPSDLLILPEKDDEIGSVEIGGLCWFQLLISASYLGIASALAERALAAGKADPSERAMLGIELEGAMAALCGAASWIDTHRFDADSLPAMLFVRFSVQRAIERAAAQAAELVGGMAFVRSTEVGYLFAASRALAYHPPSRGSASAALLASLGGEPPELV